MDWIYGRQAVRLALMPGALRRPHRLAATPAGRRSVEDLLPRTLEQQVAEPRELERLTGAREHQGLALLVGDYPYVPRDQLLGGSLVVVLDEVSDPRNLGAVARSALAAGADGLALPRHRSAAVTPAAVKAAAGATEHLPIAHVTNLVGFLAELKKAGFWVYGAAGDSATSYLDLDLAGKVAFVFGSEGRGLRPLVARTCDALAAIPTEGPVESLNVSVAAAVVLFELRRRETTGARRPWAVTSPSRPDRGSSPGARR
jgi:23S rRNA (guanosine2251-2'-O)-methyltransferase